MLPADPTSISYCIVQEKIEAAVALGLMEAGKPAEARAAMERRLVTFRKLIALSPQYHPYYAQLAWILATTEFQELRDPVESLRLAAKARSINPESIAAQQAEVAAYYRLGRWSDADKSSEKAMNLSAKQRLISAGIPLDPPLKDGYSDLLHLNPGRTYFDAMCKWQLGDQVQAREIYTQVTKDTQKETSRSTRLIREEAEAVLGIGPPAAGSSGPQAAEP